MLLKIKNERGEWIAVDVIRGEPGKNGTFDELTEEQKATLKGADGYTPIKGVDYFDGYTPVKGVDYFDGKDGVDGAPGKDGKDGVNGKDGAPGKDGVDGKDYVLTAADKQEIAGMVEGGNVDLSDYYTKEEIDGLLANLPTGEALPNAEGAEF